MKYDVIGVGNALLDYQVEVPFGYLKTHKLQRGSMTLVDARWQADLITELKQTFGEGKIKKSSGGCAANTLAGITNFGGTAYYITKIANDENGNFYKTDLEKAGVKYDMQPSERGNTGTCLALITPDAERTMLSHLGISIELNEKDIQPMRIEQGAITYIEGYLWDSPTGREACKKAIHIAKEKKKKVAFTCSDSWCVERHREDFVNYAKTSIDILFCNEAEAVELTRAQDVFAAFKILREWCEIVNITTGPRGALISHKGEKICEEIPTWSVQLVDKLGAGDLYAAGTLYGLTHGKSLRESAFLGCYSATKIIQQMSGRLQSSLKDDIEMAERGPNQDQANNKGLIRAIAV